MPPKESYHEIKHLLEKNSELVEDNNRLLKKLHRFHIVSAWFKVVWLALLIGLPFAVYFYILEPYFSALGASYEQFHSGIGEIPGLKFIDQFLGSIFGNSGE